jgi:hypothetical protein
MFDDPEAIPDEVVVEMARLWLEGKTPAEIGALTNVDPDLVEPLILQRGCEAAAERRSNERLFREAMDPSRN